MDAYILLTLVFYLPVLVNSHYYQQKLKKDEQCECQCSGFLTEGHTRDLSFCQKLAWLEKEFKSIKQGVESRTQYIKELQDLKEIVSIQENYVETLQEEVETLKKEISNKGNYLPTPEALVMRPDDQMLGDSGGQDTRMTDTDKELAKNVSSLLAKVEEVENRTTQVQEELKSERRVRRHLEEDLNETRYSIRALDDKLHNVSYSRVDHVEEVLLSTLENMNKTFFQDHLQKLFYKVDGVVYKNETKELDKRLDQVENELLQANNNSELVLVTLEIQALAEEVNALRNISQNLTEELATKNLRLDNLEKSQKLEEQQSKIFSNVTNLIQDEVKNIRNAVTDIRNKTNDLESTVLLQQANFSSSIKEALNAVTLANSEIDNLNDNFTRSSGLYSEMKKELQILAADLAVVENRIHDLSLASESEIQDMHRKMDNVTDTMESSIQSLVALLVEKNADSSLVNSSNPNGNSSSPDVGKSSRSRSSGAEPEPCTLPSFNDTHLLVTMEENDEGQQELEFGCRPIGRYVLNLPSVPLRCENGEWNGPMPSCVKLLDEEEINERSKELESKNPCLYSSGETPDPTDCRHFFKCWIGRSERFSCPSMLHFDKIAKRCDYQRVANCKTYVTEETVLIANVTPTVYVEPDTIDKPFGLMGTGDSGHLVVYPGTRFNLKCIFPHNRWGPANWRVDLFLPNSSHKELTTTREKNTVKTTVVANTQYDSGVYSCVSPFGKQNSLTIIVQAVTCPTIPLGPGIKDIVYIPNPDGVYRALTTPVHYMCSSGTKIKGYCMANGKWSRSPPSPEECQSEEFVPQTLWGCPYLQTDGHPNLVLDRNEHDMSITFKCAGSTNLIGSTFTRCYNGNWTIQVLPRCVPKKY